MRVGGFIGAPPPPPAPSPTPTAGAEQSAREAEQAHRHGTKPGTAARPQRPPTPPRSNTPLRSRKPPSSSSSPSSSSADETSENSSPTPSSPEETGSSRTRHSADLQADSSADPGEQDHGESSQDGGGRRRHKGFAFSEIQRSIDGNTSRSGRSGRASGGGPERTTATAADTSHLAQTLLAATATTRPAQLALVREYLLAHLGPAPKITLSAIKALLVQHQQPSQDEAPSPGDASRNALLPVLLLHALRPRLPQQSAAAAGRLQVLQRMADDAATLPPPRGTKP